MTATCCARGAPPAVLGRLACRRPRRWGRFCARSRSGTCASSTACSAEALDAGVEGRRRARRRAAGDRRRQLRRRGLRLRASRAPRSATPGMRGYHPILATRADTGEVLHIRLRKGSANTPRGMLRFCDELIARVDARRRDRRRSCCAPTRGSGTRKVFERLERAGWQYSIGVRTASRRPRGDRGDRRETPGRRSTDYPDDGEAQIAETDARRPAADRPAHPPARRPSRAVARLAALRVPHQPHRRRSRSSRPSTASTPSSSWPSATSKTKRSRTSPPATSTPTPPGP